MLHVSAFAPYAAAIVPFALTLLLQGTRALGFDGHPLQHWEALLFLWVGVEVFRQRSLSEWERLSLGAGAAWLCTDELFMVHECAKWKWHLGSLGRDPLILAYVVIGCGIGIRVMAAHRARRAAAPHFVVAMLAALVALAADLSSANAFAGIPAVAFEEAGELIAIAGAIGALRADEGDVRLLPAIGWVAFSAMWMGASVWLVRPWLCPARLL